MRAALSIALPALLLAASAPAQTGGGGQAGGLLSQLGGGQGGGLLGSLGGGGLGGALGSAGINNVTGLLGYCVKNQLLGNAGGGAGAGGASGLLGKLAAKPGVANSGGSWRGSRACSSRAGAACRCPRSATRRSSPCAARSWAARKDCSGADRAGGLLER